MVPGGGAGAGTSLEQQRRRGGDPVTLPGRPPAAPPPPAPPPQASPPGISFDPPSGDLFTSDPLQQAGSLDAIAALVRACTKCRLCDGRRNAVPGEGREDARLVVVGEVPAGWRTRPDAPSWDRPASCSRRSWPRSSCRASGSSSATW